MLRLEEFLTAHFSSYRLEALDEKFVFLRGSQQTSTLDDLVPSEPCEMAAIRRNPENYPL